MGIIGDIPTYPVVDSAPTMLGSGECMPTREGKKIRLPSSFSPHCSLPPTPLPSSPPFAPPSRPCVLSLAARHPTTRGGTSPTTYTPQNPEPGCIFSSPKCPCPHTLSHTRCEFLHHLLTLPPPPVYTHAVANFNLTDVRDMTVATVVSLPVGWMAGAVSAPNMRRPSMARLWSWAGDHLFPHTHFSPRYLLQFQNTIHLMTASTVHVTNRVTPGSECNTTLVGCVVKNTAQLMTPSMLHVTPRFSQPEIQRLIE
jgi:hypothetical protein